MPHRDPERRRTYKATWYEANKESHKARMRRRRAEMLERRRAYDRAYYRNNRAAILASRVVAYRVNRESHSARTRARSIIEKHQITDRQWETLARKGRK